MRASLPFSRLPTGPGTTTSGVGDLNANFFYLLDTAPGTNFGVGPQLTLPTASEDETGTGKYQGGAWPSGARFTFYREHSDRTRGMTERFVTDDTLRATERVHAIAGECGLAPATFAI